MPSANHQDRFADNGLIPVEGIEPHAGFQLLRFDYEDGEGFTTPAYVVRGADRDRLLNVSRFNFTPTQARFNWLVDFGLPEGVLTATGARGPLCDAAIDKAIALAARRAA